jgi:amidase
MKLAEYASYDALGLAGLVARREVSPSELARTAAEAIGALDARLKSVVEIYPERIERCEEAALGSGPFRGVPFLIKDVFGHEAGRRIEFGSRLCAGMTVETSTAFLLNLKKAGLNIIGRSAAPEYSMAATTESAMFGKTSNPWREGYSTGGSSGGAQAAVTAGLVPMAHGSDIGGSIRIPASLCGGVGLKPSRGRVSLAPVVDEPGFGYSKNLIQARTVRDVAAILDCVSAPEPGDPFVIPRPAEPYATLARAPPPRLKIGIVLDELVGVPVDPEVAAAVRAVGRVLEGEGHSVAEARVEMGGLDVLRATTDLFFFGFDVRLDGYARRSGLKPGPGTLEPVIHSIYEHAREISAERFMAAIAALNVARRRLGAFYGTFDVWLSPTTARVAEPWGRYDLSRPGVGWHNLVEELYRIPVQFTIPHNIMGTPAISLPTAMHVSGLPIGVQLAGRPAEEHVVLQLATLLEEAMPWRDRVPPLHVSRL